MTTFAELGVDQDIVDALAAKYPQYREHRPAGAVIAVLYLRTPADVTGLVPLQRELLAAALERARYRVVVKRPRKASAIEGAEPTTRIEGKSSRYDVYAIRALPPQ